MATIYWIGFVSMIIAFAISLFGLIDFERRRGMIQREKDRLLGILIALFFLIGLLCLITVSIEKHHP